ncbi:Myb-like DNA-binding protein BAS1 [Nakaseomyces bracarensis]|uniref:Myb-like DNA-binding protein BAS1 n=1 Tax=Nakaseomyces bracarensis TaxID=273131 RepID=A0ABR4NMH0_9SACH
MAQNGKTRKRYGKKGENFDLLSVTESLGYRTNRKASKNYWSKEDDTKLGQLVNEELVRLGLANGISDLKNIHDSLHYSRKIRWDNILFAFKNKYRTPKLLRKRWISALDPNIKRGKWTPEEDEKLVKAYEKLGPKWLDISSEILGRTEDQCSKRYIEILGPSSKERLREWTLEEELSLISKVKKYGTKWRTISSEMVNRPSLTCRNRWRRIITLVVRGQAPPKIMDAVKENKNIDLANILAMQEKKNDNSENEPTDNDGVKSKSSVPELDKESTNEAFTYPTTYEVSLRSAALKEGHKSDSGAAATAESEVQGLNGIETSNEEGYPFSESYSDINKDNTESSLTISERTNRDSGAMSLFELKHDKRSNRSMSPINTKSLFEHNIAEDKDAKIDSSVTSSKNFTSPKSLLEHSRDDTPSLEQQFSETKISERAKKHSSSHTQWKFTLKDEQGFSISNGNISNSELVKELIAQAKKYSVKISIHQHIHHHYGGANIQNFASPNINEPASRTNVHNKSVNDVKGFPLSNIGQSPVFDSPNDFKMNFDIGDNTFMNSPNSNPFGLDVDTPASNDFYAKSNNDDTESPQREKTASTQDCPGTNTGSSSGSFSTPGSDLHDVGPNRMTHFTFLSAAVRPQLGSSDSTRHTDLQNLLNDSQQRTKKKRRRGTNSHDKSRPHTPSIFNSNAHPGEESSNSVSKAAVTEEEHIDHMESNSINDDEDEVDFWESLRSLANNPVSPNHNAAGANLTEMDIDPEIAGNNHPDISYSEMKDNYPIATSSEPINYIDQFIGNNRGISPSTVSEDSESFFLPLNPS